MPLIASFQAHLKEVEANVEKRDATRWLSYRYLRPSRVSNSIHV